MSGTRFGRRDLFKRAAAMGAGAGVFGAVLDANPATAQTAGTSVDKVPTHSLGRTGAKIPILLQGLGRSVDPSYDRSLHRGLGEGLFYLDTGMNYGQSHVGVTTFQEQVGRDKVWITSKVPMETQNTSTVEHYVTNLEKMLPELKTDWLDAFFMHGLNNPDMLGPQFIKMADDLKKRGLFKYFGFSAHHGNVVELMNKAAKIGVGGIDMIQFRYSFRSFGDLELNKAIDACKKAGIGLIAMKTHASIPSDEENVVQWQSENWSLVQAKLKAAWADERIDALVTAMGNLDELDENIAAAKSTVKLAMSEFMQLNRLAAQTAHLACMGCNHICESHIDGELRVSDLLRYLMYHECHGKEEEARLLYHALRPGERDFEHLDLAAAVKACPQGIDIPKRLAQARQRLA